MRFSNHASTHLNLGGDGGAKRTVWRNCMGLFLVLAINANVTGGPVIAARKPLLAPNGRPPKAPASFVWGVAPVGNLKPVATAAEAFERLPVVNNVFSLLIIGSDARPGQSMTRSRGDSVHLLLLNPLTKRGTLVGFPRDSFVDVRGHGKAKLTATLAWGGPELMTETIRAITKVPVTNYVVTGFEGFTALIDAVEGVNVLVDPAMNDVFSGATFAKGWFSMNGNAALAFNRDRHDVANGDFGRSANQGKFILSSLARLRESTTDARGLLRWVSAFRANAATNLPVTDLLVFAQAARQIDPAAIDSLVVPGTNAMVKVGKTRQAVVLLTPSATSLFADLATDTVRGN